MTEQSDHTLETLIDQQIHLGHKNPHDFFDLLNQAIGDDIDQIVKPYLHDFVTEMARQRLNQRRRTGIAKITPKSLTNPETMLHSLWVPAKGTIIYKRIADMTAHDFDARADYLDRMAEGIQAHAQWCRDCSTKIRRAKVATAGELKALPSLRT